MICAAQFDMIVAAMSDFVHQSMLIDNCVASATVRPEFFQQLM
jgi:hypothetical protein